MRPISIITFSALMLGPAALVHTAQSQPSSEQVKPAFSLPPESITVTAGKPSDATIKKFIQTRRMRTALAGRMARWTKKICPQTYGLRDTYAKYISQRIRDIAYAVGAPVDPDLSCRPNIEVIFTTVPQALMDNVRKQHDLLLGYHSNLSQALQLAKVTHPIQPWYTNEILDMDGNVQVENGRCGAGTTLTTDPSTESQDTNMQSGVGSRNLTLPCAVVVHVTGWRAIDGLSSGFFNVLIVAEPAKLLDYEVGTLADYVAMMALSQSASQDVCQELPSISNLMVSGCTSVPSRITDADLAYLRGLYKMPSGVALAVQYNQLEYQMKEVLVTEKGGQ